MELLAAAEQLLALTGDAPRPRRPAGGLHSCFESLRALISGSQPDSSTGGIALGAASLVIMPSLSWPSAVPEESWLPNAVVADSTQALLCTYLSEVLLAGLVLNARRWEPRGLHHRHDHRLAALARGRVLAIAQVSTSYRSSASTRRRSERASRRL